MRGAAWAARARRSYCRAPFKRRWRAASAASTLKACSNSGGSPPRRGRRSFWTRPSAIGVNPPGPEADGWLYAQFYISRPCDTKNLRKL